MHGGGGGSGDAKYGWFLSIWGEENTQNNIPSLNQYSGINLSRLNCVWDSQPSSLPRQGANAVFFFSHRRSRKQRISFRRRSKVGTTSYRCSNYDRRLPSAPTTTRCGKWIRYEYSAQSWSSSSGLIESASSFFCWFRSLPPMREEHMLRGFIVFFSFLI